VESLPPEKETQTRENVSKVHSIRDFAAFSTSMLKAIFLLVNASIAIYFKTLSFR